jgi:hypothetical protein
MSQEETHVRALTTVSLEPDEAFALFTEEVDAWWRHGSRFRAAIEGKEGTMRFEPGEGGRLLEVYGPDHHFELGRVRVWEPGKRLVFLMGGRDFAPDEWTEVKVRFERIAKGTQVSIDHYGFDALGMDHGVWHGQGREAFVGSMGLWWGDLLVAMRRFGLAARFDEDAPASEQNSDTQSGPK